MGLDTKNEERLEIEKQFDKLFPKDAPHHLVIMNHETYKEYMNR